ncbi:MAG: tRNA (guanine-N(7)-)-methyltransferase non-catalytic subunit trm82 [Peltula sp. TS41687]|nr:MAG: tRNA (guanine-N(7)-)-methyltransferase non-catalytic subunit trm82 [Peltula sp. TS41687]
MKHPFQSLLACPSNDDRPVDLLIAAAGAHLYAFNSSTGGLVSSWRQESTSSATPNGPPEKKQKLSSAETETVDAPIAPPDEQSGKQSGQGNQDSNIPYFAQLALTRKGGHIVAVTDRDKCIKLFALDISGQLTLLSERFMPKRPSAIAITDDDATIICADKFGDVYALPLLETSNEDRNIPLQELHPKGKRRLSANLTTIHTDSNKRALHSQLRQGKTAEPKSIDFSHQLLLGHVSMITDLALATIVEGGVSERKSRNYVITCDRDEHIRISRGMPQSHFIEGYCLGHKQFVNRICVPKSRPNILISGGGDDCLYVWDWMSGIALERVDIQSLVKRFLNSNPDFLDIYVAEDSNLKSTTIEQGRDENAHSKTGVESATTSSNLHSSSAKSESVVHIAITGIWSLTDAGEGGRSEETSTRILVTCEGIPALFAFHLSSGNSLTYDQSLPLKGNPLGTAIYESLASIVVSIDNVHKPCSTTQTRDSSTNSDVLLQCFSLKGDNNDSHVWEENAKWVQPIEHINSQGSFETSSLDEMGGLLYSVESFRKRGMED